MVPFHFTHCFCSLMVYVRVSQFSVGGKMGTNQFNLFSFRLWLVRLLEIVCTFLSEISRMPNIIAPGEIKFQDVCCVGMTTRCCIPLQNPNDRWLHCTLRVVTVNIDGRDRAPNLSPFVMKQQVILGPNSVEEIEVNSFTLFLGYCIWGWKISNGYLEFCFIFLFLQMFAFCSFSSA